MLPFEGNNFYRGRVTGGDLPFKKNANKHGPKAVTSCRFIPFFRTFVPFLAIFPSSKPILNSWCSAS
jgi:hypothetical protein